MAELRVPVIDLTEMEGSGRVKIGEEIALACESYGFFQIINHGVDVELMDKIRDVVKHFFHLPEEKKLEYEKKPGIIEGYGHRNMKAYGNSLTLATNHFFYYLHPMSKRNECLWPRDPPDFLETFQEYAKVMKILAEKLLCLMSEALGLPPRTLQERLEGPSGEALNTVRANYYPPCTAEELEIGLDCHSDPGGITLLLQDDAPGLQVKFKDDWIDVQPILNGFCVNVADIIEILSNGRFKSIEHRGMACRVSERVTIPFFYNPAFDHVLGPLEELVDEAHPALYNSTTYHNYFFNVFMKRGVGSGKDYIKETRL